MGKGQHFEFGEYDQFVREPNYYVHLIKEKDSINAFYQALRNSNLAQIKRTPSGSIKSHEICHVAGAYDVRKVITEAGVFKGVIITVILKGYVFVYKCGAFKVDKSELTGVAAFRKFKKACERHGINLDEYADADGKGVKQDIESPSIQLFVTPCKLYQHVNHIDINNAYPAGVVKDYPEFAPVFAYLRAKDKLIGDMALGYCQSQYAGYKYSKLAKAGVNNTKDYVFKLVERLWNANYDVLLTNTDGIYYTNKKEPYKLYHDADEGDGLGKWRHDIIDADFMPYSAGQYWFKDADGFHPRARGFYTYEMIKPREEWDEFDFDKAVGSLAVIIWDDERGFDII